MRNTEFLSYLEEEDEEYRDNLEEEEGDFDPQKGGKNKEEY